MVIRGYLAYIVQKTKVRYFKRLLNKFEYQISSFIKRFQHVGFYIMYI